MKDIKIEKDKLIPCVPTRDLVVFEDMTVNFEVARGFTISAVKKAMNGDGLVFLIAQRSVAVEEPEKKDLYKYGVLGEVRQVIKSPSGVYRCLVNAFAKGKLLDLVKIKDNCLYATVKTVGIGKEKVSEVELTALMRQVSEAFENYLEVIPRIPKELYYDVASAETPKELFEAIAYNIPLPTDDKQIMLDLNTYGERLAYLLSTLSHEIEVSMLEREIHDHVASTIDNQQREYYIREQIRALHNELGDGEVDESDEAQSYLTKIAELTASDEVKDKLTMEAKRLAKMPSGTQEAVVIRNYLDTCLALPWSEKTEDRRDIKKAESILEKDHYGLKKVKERVLENLAVRMMTPDIKGQVICLYGPPGVGKTSVGKSIARALDRKYVRVSLGGVRDESDIRGHRKTYVGAMPGRIIDAMRQAGTKNPVILLDEIDKMSNDFRGDPSSAMLEVLDGEQNSGFRDHYVELPFDLSEVLFITTANSLDTVAAPLLDRMEVIELSSYTREEKFNIAKLHLIPKQREKHGLKASQIRISNDAVYTLIDNYTKEAGVRKLERAIATLCRKAVKKLLENEEETKITFKASNLEEYLGHKKYLPDLAAEKDEVGLVNGLAWTSVGGVLMPLEVLVLDGKGKVELTGSLGDVMKESAQIAVSYCRSVADKYEISPDFYEKKDLHVHAPEGAVPKDGPSAGVTMVTAMVSALSGIPVRKDVAMTGEITLHGKVLPIGGLREKLMAAYKAKIKTVIIPAKNKGDLDEVDDVVKASLEIIFADELTTVLEHALVKVNKPFKPSDLKTVKRTKKAVLTAN
ncbi:MAG: endopeptidase La [Ruminococcus sp.]|nr:endopeptidase La [Ruminococcus sp.]